MEDRDTSILTQVGFKGAIEWAKDKVDLTSPEGQATFEQVFSYLTESVFLGVQAALGTKNGNGNGNEAGQLIRGAFPGTQQVYPQQQAVGSVATGQQPTFQQQQPQFTFPQAQQQQSYTQQPQQQASGGGEVGPHNYDLRVKGPQHAPIPQWAYEEAAAHGIHEVWDNRDSDPSLRRPLFKATQGGRDAHPFWGPGNKR